MRPNQFDTLSQAVTSLQERGFTCDFYFDETGAHIRGTDESILPEQVTIIEHHRFEGNTDESDMSVVYGVELDDGRKGAIIDSFGTYANTFSTEFLRQIKIQEEN